MRQMMPFNWQSAIGWIVLSGNVDSLSEIRARSLGRCDAGGAIAYISLADDLGDGLMDDMAELGATSGYLVDLDEQDNNEVYERLSDAAMIVVEGCGAGGRLLRLLRHTALHAMEEALNRGGLVLLEGEAAAIAGDYVLNSAGEISAGLGLVQNALVAADTISIAENATLRSARLHLPDTTFVGLAPGSALVLGPENQIETWGEGQVAINLGDITRASAEDERDRAIE